MTEQSNQSGSSFSQGMTKVLRFLVRLIFVLVIGVLIGLALFYGVPRIYRRLVWPVQENSARIAILEEQVTKNSESIFDNDRSLQGRIAVVETEIAELREEVSDRAGNQEVLRQESERLAERITALEADLETQQQEIEKVQSDFAATTAELERDIEQAQEQLEETQRELTLEIQDSAEAVGDLQGRVDEAMARVLLLQTAQDVVKVRLLLVEENVGAARDTLELAIAHLDQAGQFIPSQADVLADLRERMLDADDLIAQGSFRLRPSLEAIWADVMDLVTPLTGQSPITATEIISPTLTPTVSP